MNKIRKSLSELGDKRQFNLEEYKGWMINVDNKRRMALAFPKECTVIGHEFQEGESMKSVLEEMKKTLDEFYIK